MKFEIRKILLVPVPLGLAVGCLIIVGIVASLMVAALAADYGASKKMLGFTDEPEAIVMGYYSNSGYYCVLTDGRTQEEIASTNQHEICHALAALDHKHFCE